MGLLIPTNNNRNKLGFSYWVRVIALLSIIAVLTWYGKFHKPEPRISREHGLAVWMLPHQRGLGTLIALPDDDNDSNRTRTGLRLWLNPPREPAWIGANGGIRYRGGLLGIIGDSLPSVTLDQIASTLDTGGQLLWLGLPVGTERQNAQVIGPRRLIQGTPAAQAADWFGELSGEDIRLELRFLQNHARDYILNLEQEGHRLRFWSTLAALEADSSRDTLSVGVLLFPVSDALPDMEILRNAGALIWNGKAQTDDSTRIGLSGAETMALAATAAEWETLRVRRLSLRGWLPQVQ